MKKIVFLGFLLVAIIANASGLKIAGGAGYKKPLMEVVKLYEAKKGIKLEPIFGNMKQITTQAKNSDIALIIGDKRYLSTKSGLEFSQYNFLGRGYVVLAYAKGVKIESVADIKSDSIKKVAMPEPKKAIYGTAAAEFLKASNLYMSVKDKLYVVATVPQVVNYLVSGEVEVGIINLTAALAFEDKLGGYLKVEESTYNPIEIVVGELPTCKSATCKDFVEFLQTDAVKKVFQKYGM
jgi:molybdate transport system substrate-binding protein